MDNVYRTIRHFYTETERPDEWVASQIMAARAALERGLEIELKPYQYEALVCMTTDVVSGLAFPKQGTFDTSRLLLAVNTGMFQIAASEFFSFAYLRGRIDKRLWRKRNVEQVWFLRGTLILTND